MQGETCLTRDSRNKLVTNHNADVEQLSNALPCLEKVGTQSEAFSTTADEQPHQHSMG